MEELVNKTLRSVLLIQRGFRRLLMRKRLRAIAEEKKMEDGKGHVKKFKSTPLASAMNAPSVKKAFSSKSGKRLIISERPRKFSVTSKASTSRVIPSASTTSIKTQSSNGQPNAVSRKSTGSNLTILTNVK